MEDQKTPKETVQEKRENKEILKRYRNILRLAKPHLENNDDAKLIRRAFEIAVKAHENVRRKSGEPYIYHPLEVTRIVTEEMGLGTTSVICALLHDVVEDSDWEIEEIEEIFGDRVATIVDGLTKVPFVFEATKSRQAETFRKVLLTISEDIRVVLIKIADRLDNMRTLDSMPKDKQLKIKSETQYIYAPLAHRLGLYNIKSELEDLGLKYSNRSVYDLIREKIKRGKSARTRFINTFKRPIEEVLEIQGFDYEIKGRMKSISSIWNKMQRQGVPFEEVYDLFAIRIIVDVPNIEDEKSVCWRVYSIVTDFYQPNIKRLRDWISMPKSTGYESLHTTVMSKKGQWVEVQIRTKRMDEIAEKGYAAHWKYKGQSKDKTEQGIETWLRMVRESLENNNVSALEFMDDFRSNLFSKEVYVFTPKGDLQVLSSNATVLDFAFEIHSEIGLRCLGAKVNHKLVPLDYVLQNGDQIEILKSSKPKVNKDWLQFVKTSKARTRIKQYLNKAQSLEAAEGQEIVQRKLKQLKIPVTNEVLAQLVDYFGVKTPNELYQKLGAGQIDHTEIKKFREETEKHKDIPTDTKKLKKKIKEEQSADELIIGDDNDIEYSLSPCCHPIPGDDIFGIVTVSRGIRIHRTSCPNAVAMMASFGDRIIPARWAADKDKRFEVGVEIIGTDRVGLVNDVTRVISNQHKMNIVSISINAAGSVFNGEISLLVESKSQLDKLNEELMSIEGVVKVMRYES